MFCAICLIDQIKVCRKLPCGHKFCIDCIASWESINPQCPMCRQVTARPNLSWPTTCIVCGKVNCSEKHSNINHVVEIEYYCNDNDDDNDNNNISSQIPIRQELTVAQNNCNSFSTQRTFSVPIFE